MSHYEIPTLKAEQAKRTSQRINLLEQCIPFRDGLLERLEQFTVEATDNGLNGVKQCKRKTHTNKIYEVTFALNGFDLAFVATDDVFPIDLESDALASRMFIYFDGDENNEPHIEIVVQGPVDGTYDYKMRWFAKGQPVHIAAGRSVTRQDGHEAAEALLHHIYGFRTLWIERPSLGMVRERKYETRTLGFQAMNA